MTKKILLTLSFFALLNAQQVDDLKDGYDVLPMN